MLIRGSWKSILAIFGLILLHYSCSSQEDELWKGAQLADTISAYENYLTLHPDGDHVTQARGRLATLREPRDWSRAEATDTPSAYDEYLSRHPAGAHQQAARARRSDLVRPLEWERAQEENTLGSYREFLRNYPGSPESDEANAHVAALLDQQTERAYRRLLLEESKLPRLPRSEYALLDPNSFERWHRLRKRLENEIDAAYVTGRISQGQHEHLTRINREHGFAPVRH